MSGQEPRVLKPLTHTFLDALSAKGPGVPQAGDAQAIEMAKLPAVHAGATWHDFTMLNGLVGTPASTMAVRLVSQKPADTFGQRDWIIRELGRGLWE